jgi:hypothetical protein
VPGASRGSSGGATRSGGSTGSQGGSDGNREEERLGGFILRRGRGLQAARALGNR